MKKWKVTFEVIHMATEPWIDEATGKITWRLPNIPADPIEIHADEKPTEQQIHNFISQKIENIQIEEIIE